MVCPKTHSLQMLKPAFFMFVFSFCHPVGSTFKKYLESDHFRGNSPSVSPTPIGAAVVSSPAYYSSPITSPAGALAPLRSFFQHDSQSDASNWLNESDQNLTEAPLFLSWSQSPWSGLQGLSRACMIQNPSCNLGDFLSSCLPLRSLCPSRLASMLLLEHVLWVPSSGLGTCNSLCLDCSSLGHPCSLLSHVPHVTFPVRLAVFRLFKIITIQ